MAHVLRYSPDMAYYGKTLHTLKSPMEQEATNQLKRNDLKSPRVNWFWNQPCTNDGVKNRSGSVSYEGI